MAGSILDTFLILFKADTKDVDEKIKKSEEEVAGFKNHLSSINQVANRLGSSIKESFASIAGATVAALSIESLKDKILETEEYADQLGKLATATGNTTESLSAWSDTIKMLGGTQEQFQGTIRQLSSMMADMEVKGKSRLTPFFKQLGIQMTDAHGKVRNILDLLPDLANAFQKMPKTESFAIGQRMGLDPTTIELLQKGGSEVNKLVDQQKKLGVITSDDAGKAEKFEESLANVSHAFRSIAISIGDVIVPALNVVTDMFLGLTEFTQKYGVIAKSALIGIGVAIATYVLPALLSAAIESVIAFAPFFAVAAIIGAIAAVFGLMYDDIQNFLHGNKSVIGEILNKFPIIGKIAKGIGEAFKIWAGIIIDFWKGVFFAIMHPVEAWHIFVNAVKNGMAWLKQEFPTLGKVIDVFGESFKAIGHGVVAVWDGLLTVIKAIGSAIMAVVHGTEAAYQKIKGVFSKSPVHVSPVAQNTLGMAGSSAISSVSSNSLTSNSSNSVKSTTVNVGEVNVKTQATDPNQIAGAIGTSLNTHMRQTINNFDDGVAA